MTNANSTSLSILAGTVLKLVNNNNNSLLEGNEITIYKQIIGSVLYLLNNTHSDILYAIG